ncbi:Scr1 family TA system antitoxin-like transcriptional regulator [Actinokineospora cianjurensis]|nr:Scr1 family TA system antitoxin-like transcriptional regulator [Actinokineospora cianjurensis]
MAVTQTVPQVMLLHALAKLKDTAARGDAEVARALGWQTSKVNRLRTGQSRITPDDARALATAYGASAEHAETLTGLARAAGARSVHQEMFPAPFRLMIDLEERAGHLRQYQTETVPGLLQTVTYRLALEAGAGVVTGGDLVAHSVRQRQALLTRDDPPRVEFVLSESCLRRVRGGPEVMADQLRALLDVAALERVDLRVLPFDAASAPFASLGYSVVHVPGRDEVDPLTVVYVEQAGDAHYLRDPHRVRAHTELFARQQSNALSPQDTRRVLHAIVDDYDKDSR